MDLSAAVTYRGLALNDAERSAPQGKNEGILLEKASYGSVSGVGYTEKRARGDGLDGSDVYLGGRRIRLRGQIFGTARGDLFDRVDQFNAIFTPTRAYDADSGAWGYLPLYFSRPTADTAAEPNGFPSGTIPCFINVRPLATPQIDWDRDRTTLVAQWDVFLEARDPRIYVDDLIEVALTGATSGSGNLINRGNYPTPVTILLNADTDDAQDFTFLGAGSDLVLAIPAVTGGPCSVTLDAATGVVILDSGGQETTRMDLLEYTTGDLLPFVQPGSSAYSWALSVENLLTGSKLSYRDAFI